MPADYHHGVRVFELNNGTRPIRTIETSIIGVVCSADDADAATFPLNKPVMLVGASRYIGKAGTTGTLAKTLDAIKDQCEPVIYVVRVEEGADDATATTNVIGGSVAGKLTGLQALLSAKAKFGAKPRILGVPGYDHIPAIAHELEIIAEKLRGFAYAALKADTKEEAVAARNSYSSKRLMLIWPEFVGWDTASNSEIHLSASARALGLRAKIDNDIGWHKTLSNVPVNGVDGISKDLYFDLQASATDTNYLNSHDVTTLIREKGFRFWGSRTCSADKLFAFESATRSGDIIADTIAEAHFWAVDKPMSATLFQDIIEGIQAKLDLLVAQGYLLGASVWWDENFNPKESIKSGKAIIDYDYTPVPPLEDLGFNQRITDKYIVDMTSQL